MTALASYVPGGWVAVSAPGAWLLVALPPDHPIVLRCWGLMSVDIQAEDVLDALVSGGIRAAPDFAFACATGQRRVLARGAASILVTDSVGAVQLKVSAAPTAVWAEEGFDETVDLLLLTSGTDPASEIELPMASGVTMASSIRIQLHGSVHRAVGPAPVDRAAAVGSTPVGQPAAGEPASAVPPAEKPADPGRPDERTDQPPGRPTEAGSAPEEPARSYDFLFGATQRPPQPAEEEGIAGTDDRAANEPAGTDPAADGSVATTDPGLTAGWSTMAPPDLPLTEEPCEPAGESGGPHIIDAVPWLAADTGGGRGAAASPTDQLPVNLGKPVPQWAGSQPARPAVDDVAQTVDRAALLAAAGLQPAGPTVLAGYCPAGHLSPPYAATCRVCQAPMPPGQHGVEIARPPLGVIRLADGGSVTLDRGVLFGRAPETGAGTEERPHLVRLVSPENDVSRNHAQIVIDGWHVYVKDLGSTNGTVVTLPGRAPVRLRPDDLQLLEHGSQITLADEVTVTFEVIA